MKEPTEIRNLEKYILNIFIDTINNSDYSDWKKEYSYVLIKDNLHVRFYDNDNHFALTFSVYQDAESLTFERSPVYSWEGKLSKYKLYRIFYSRYNDDVYKKLKSIRDTHKHEKKYNKLKMAMDNMPISIVRKDKLDNIQKKC